MSAGVTGDRVTWKIRATVERFPELGALRHVEGNPPSPATWAVTVVTWTVFSTAPALGNGTWADVPVQAVAMGAFFGLVLWFIGSEKILVLERGLILGSFAPFVRPYVVPFHHVEAASFTVARPMPRIAQMLPGAVPFSQGRTALWARTGVAFVGASGPAAYRDRVDQSGILSAAPRHKTVWWFGTWRPTTPLLRALEAALVAYGAPGAQGLSARATSVVQLSGSRQDAAEQLPAIVGALARR